MQSARLVYAPFRPFALILSSDSQPGSLCLDLAFSRLIADATVVALPPDLAVLMVGVAARQAASPTALAQARLRELLPDRDLDWFAPAHGAFNHGVALLLRRAGD